MEIAINSAALPRSHWSPYYLNYGFHHTTENEIYAQFAPNHMEDVSEFLQRIRLDWQTAHESMLLQQERMKQRTDQNRRKSEVAVGDEVLVSVNSTGQPFKRKESRYHITPDSFG